jgi:hypothetical protein
MDSFDGLFLEEDVDEVDNDLPPLELKSKLDFSVEDVLSTQPSSKEYVRCQNNLEGILGLLCLKRGHFASKGATLPQEGSLCLKRYK